ncbi:tyrosine-type recombinase/integrase [Noviherbaspirillum soli]|uniref:tyrosine-type recombinase/integrase n=1 Tax=Noviherbaspirillum soli TaxID=1064518 RepID=UPI00188B7E1B|nr:integrase family protein [Noviherbaspirillum soli]
MAREPETRTINLTEQRVRELTCPEGKTDVFYPDEKVKGFTVRVYATGVRTFVYRYRILGKSAKIVIGSIHDMHVSEARRQAQKYGQLVAEGKDPREAKADNLAGVRARQEEAKRKAVTFRDAWETYLEARKSHWGERNYLDHIRTSAERTKKQQAGVLARFSPIPLNKFTSQAIADMVREESPKRPTAVSQAYRYLRAFIRWLQDVPQYQGIVSADLYKSRQIRDSLPKSKAKNGDCLERPHLAAWFREVQAIPNPIISTYLQGLLLTGARREELAKLQWKDIDLKAGRMILDDKVDKDSGRTIPIPPYLTSLFDKLKAQGEGYAKKKGRDLSPYVFESKSADRGYIAEPRIAHNQALERAELPHVSLHGLRRSFATLAEESGAASGLIAQIQGHRPSAIAEKHYKRRSQEVLLGWHTRIEAWFLGQAGISFEYAEPIKNYLADLRRISTNG